MTRTRLLAAGLVLPAVTVLAGCQGGAPGAAAVVGDQRITERSLQRSVQDILELKRKAQVEVTSVAQVQRDELQERIEMVLVDRIAAREGLSVDDGEVTRAIETVRGQAGSPARFDAVLANDEIAPRDLNRTVHYILLRQKLGETLAPGAQPGDDAVTQAVRKALVEEGNKVGVDVSPRYGSWDARDGFDVPRDELSKPDTSAATPGSSQPGVGTPSPEATPVP